MRMHKMEEKEIQAVREFIWAAEAMLEREKFSFTEPWAKWKDWDDDDDDKKIIQRIVRDVAREEGCSEDSVDGRIVAYEYIAKKYTHRLQVANMTASILIENCCDPHKNYLDYRPSLIEIHVAPEQ